MNEAGRSNDVTTHRFIHIVIHHFAAMIHGQTETGDTTLDIQWISDAPLLKTARHQPLEIRV
jgi:hypothetical protein